MLMKPHMVYSLVQAITHVTKPIKKFNKLFKSPKLRAINWKTAVPNLTALSQAVDAEAQGSRFAQFVEASSEKTNVRETRATRFKWMCKALTREQI
jgi:hypothetical protein